MKEKYTVIIPAFNEEGAIGPVLEEILTLQPKDHFEIIVVNDKSRDSTAAVASRYPVRIIENVQNFGYGYSLKNGIRTATHDNIVIIDADGSYPISSIPKLIAEYEKGFDMVVGARQGAHYKGSVMKRIARFFFRAISEFATGRRIPDINSGCRVFKKNVVLRFFHTLSSGFSFTTTITLAFMLNAFSVGYIPIEYHKRKGTSKVHYGRDTLRSLQIIVEAIILYNPLKLFLLCAIGIVISGVISALIAIVSGTLAIVFLVTAVSTCMALSLGFLGVMLRFMGNKAL